MKITLVTDAWMPQVNGVVTTLVELVRELGERGAEVQVIQPGQFRTRPCPGYAGIDLAIAPARGVAQAEASGRVHEVLASLPPRQREAVEMLVLKEQSLTEAAAATRSSKGALKVNLHRALKALRGKIKRIG